MFRDIIWWTTQKCVQRIYAGIVEEIFIFFFKKCSEEQTMEDVCLVMIGGLNGVIVEWSIEK